MYLKFLYSFDSSQALRKSLQHHLVDEKHLNQLKIMPKGGKYVPPLEIIDIFFGLKIIIRLKTKSIDGSFQQDSCVILGNQWKVGK